MMADESALAQALRAHLDENPDFFEHYPDLAPTSRPHRSGVVELADRQVLVLREKIKAMELRTAELIRYGQENEAITERLFHWARALLTEPLPSRLPDIVSGQIGQLFSVPQVALRLWDVAEEYSHLPAAEGVDPEVRALTDSMKVPYCGPNSGFKAALYLPGAGATTHSVALLPMRVGAAPKSFGLLILGSPDPRRFSPDLGTAFLDRMAELASAGLSRLRVGNAG